MPVKLGLLIAGGILALLALVVVVFSARGSFERISLSPVNGRISPAATVCLSRMPRTDRRLLDRCVRVRGTLCTSGADMTQSGRGRGNPSPRLGPFPPVRGQAPRPFPKSLRLGHEVTAVWTCSKRSRVASAFMRSRLSRSADGSG